MNTQSNDQISPTQNAAKQVLSVGKTLREAREQLGLSVNDVSNRIKFAARQIEALEDDDFVRLPEAAFVRGFVRSYARLLELDPNRLLSSLPSTYAQAATAQVRMSVDIPFPSDSGPRRYNIIILSAGFAIALSVAIFMRLHDSEPEVAKPETTTTVTPLELAIETTESTTPQPTKSTVLDESDRQQTDSELPARVIAAEPAAVAAPAKVVPVAVLKPAPQQPVLAAPLLSPVIVALAPAKAVPAASAQVVVAPLSAPANVSTQDPPLEHSLRLEFDGDAWVEIKDGNDKILTSKMYTAKSLLRISGKAPLLLVIGNARAVRLFKGGKKINLDNNITADVARIKLK